MIIMQPIFYAITWRLFKLFKFERVSAIRLDGFQRVWNDKRNLGGSDLRLAGDAYELPTIHAPTMR